MGTVLIIEDEAPLREALAAFLRHQGLVVDEAADGEEGWRQFRTRQPDLVVLDRKLPGLSGEELCRRIKGLSKVPVLMATSLVQEEAVLEAFAWGADDYIRKPYSIREVAARIQVRLSAKTGASSRLEDRRLALVVDPDAGTAFGGGHDLGLTPHEFDLLVLFLSNPGRLLSRQALLGRMGHAEEGISDRVVDAHVKNLRAKIKTATGFDAPLETVYGRGYRWGL